MKKSKTRSRSKVQEQPKDSQKQSEQSYPNCAVCRQQIKISQTMLTCSSCKKKAHKSCYNSEHDSSKDRFTCDPCSNKKRKNYFCNVCEQYDEKEMIKFFAATEQHSYIHVECAILSPITQIVSYSKLQINKRQAQNRKQMQTRKQAESKRQKTTTYNCCAKWFPGYVIQCQLCNDKSHYRCRFFWKVSGAQYYMVSKWLDKCENHDFLLNYIISKKKSNIKPFIDNIGKLPKQGQLAICSAHNDSYQWCYCGIHQDKKPVHPDYQCDQCDRSVHQTCSGLPPKSSKDFVCIGCREKDVFKRELKLHQLIAQIVKIENMSKLDQQSIRILNAFPFKYSTVLEKKIVENIKEIQAYFAKKQILKSIQNIKQNDKNDKATKKTIQMLLYLSQGDKWKQYEVHQPISTIQNSDTIQRLRLPEQVEQRLNQILSSRNKQKKKSKQFESLKQTLKKFINDWKNYECKDNNNNNTNNFVALANAIKQIQTKYLAYVSDSKEEEKKEFQNRFSKLMGNQIFGILISQNFSIHVMLAIFKKLSKVKYYKSHSLSISEGEYFELIKQEQNVFCQSQKTLYISFMSQLKKQLNTLKISFNSVNKQQKLNKHQKMLKQSPQNAHLIPKIEQQQIRQQICSAGNDTTITSLKLRLIQQNILKKKYLKICQEKDCKLVDHKLKYAAKIAEFLRKKKYLLAQDERKLFENFVGKVQFVLGVFKKGEILQQYQFQNISNGYLVEDVEVQQLSPIYLKLFHILDKWDERAMSIQFMINEFYSKCVVKNVQFDNEEIFKKLEIFYRFLFQKIQRFLEQDQKIATHLLRKICKIISYFKIQSQFSSFFQLLECVKKWANIFGPQETPANLPAFLQKPQKAISIVKNVDSKICSAIQIQKVNLNSQINKLSLFRQWCRLTQKISFLYKSKATINAIQNLKGFLDKCSYPQNAMFRKVSQLQIQSKTLNKEVNKFLQKPKLPEHFKFNEQLKFIGSKMTLEQGLAIRAILQKCNLDVYVEHQQLQNQIKQFEQLPTQLDLHCQSKTLPQLHSLRKKYIESCFKISKLQEYEKFLKRIYVLRCYNFEPPTTRQEYFQLLAVGGIAAIQLQNKTANLLRAYKTIQKAEEQLCNSNVKKRNYANLLQWYDPKYKKLKQDLKFDPTELSRLEKASHTNSKVRQEYQLLKNRVSQIEKYHNIQIELSSSIFNNKDLLNQISMIKSQLHSLVKRVQDVLPYSHPGSNIFKAEKKILDCYFSLKIRHPSLQKYQFDCRHYFKSEQIRSQLNKQNYRQYHEACFRVSEIGCKVPQFLIARVNQFMRMHKTAMDMQDEAPMSLFQTLITQGLQLRRLQSSHKDRILQMVISVYQRINEIMGQNPLSENEFSRGNQQQTPNSSQRKRRNNFNDNDDKDDENMDLENDEDDFDSDDDISDQQIYSDDNDFNQSDQSDQGNGNGNGNNGKNNQIVLDSD